MRFLIRFASLIPLIWVLGFAAWVVLLPRPASNTIRTDAIVVPTGAPGRIARGAALLAVKKADRMFISGADRAASATTIARTNKLDVALFKCCVDVGHEASNTRSNADETIEWMSMHNIKSVRLVTTDWHMPRARFELDQVAGANLRIVDDAVESDADLAVLIREYNKYLLRRVAVMGGW